MKILSHGNQQFKQGEVLNTITARLFQEGDKQHATAIELNELANELSKGELGRFLLENKGLNGFWSDVVISYPKSQSKELSGLDKTLLERLPTALATQERFNIFTKVCQEQVKHGVTMVSAPCGLMRDLIQLDYSRVKDFKLIGIDLDKDSIERAESLAKDYRLLQHCEFKQIDAWKINEKESVDVISSSGLNVYEPDKEKIKDLYRRFYNYLKPGGKLVTSFLTYPPGASSILEWDMSKINKEDLLLQKKIFVDIVGVRWQSYFSSDEIKLQLNEVGFSNINIIWDKAKIFPTAVSVKP